MRYHFLKQATIAAVALLSLPALTFAQNDQDRNERPEKKERAEVKEQKEKVEKNVQQIIITRRGDKDQKTVIEIKGDKVLVNGKDASKADDVTVNVNNQNNMRNRVYYRGNPNENFNFEFNNNDFDRDGAISLFTEDSNRAMLGVTTDEDEKGAKITAITRESAASKAGLKVGDVITKIDGDDIEDAEDVAKAVHEHKPGDKVKVSILRDGNEQTINAELEKWKGVRINNLNATIAPGPLTDLRLEPYNRNFTYSFGNGPKLGLSVQDTDNGKGVKVLSVADESSAARAGIKKGDVITKINDDDVNTTDEVVEAMREARNEATVKLQVLRDGKPQTFDVPIPRKLKTADL